MAIIEDMFNFWYSDFTILSPIILSHINVSTLHTFTYTVVCIVLCHAQASSLDFSMNHPCSTAVKAHDGVWTGVGELGSEDCHSHSYLGIMDKDPVAASVLKPLAH